MRVTVSTWTMICTPLPLMTASIHMYIHTHTHACTPLSTRLGDLLHMLKRPLRRPNEALGSSPIDRTPSLMGSMTLLYVKQITCEANHPTSWTGEYTHLDDDLHSLLSDDSLLVDFGLGSK